MNTPVAAWANHGTGELVTVGSDGQVYTLPVLEGGKLVATEWLRLGPPLPGSAAALSLGGKIGKFSDATGKIETPARRRSCWRRPATSMQWSTK